MTDQVTEIVIERKNKSRLEKPHSFVLGALFKIFVAIGTWYFSVALLEAYEFGDQAIYRRLYDQLIGVKIEDIGYYQESITTSADPAFGLLMWLGSNFTTLSHTYFISIFNVLFVVLIVEYLIRNRATLSISLFLTNYYLIVLLTGAERLKFAYMAAIAAALTAGRIRSLIYLAISTAFHIQMLILYGAFATGWLTAGMGGLARNAEGQAIRRYWFVFLLAAAGAAAIIFRYGSLVAFKISAYYANLDPAETFDLVLVLIVGLVALRSKARFFVEIVFLMAVAMVVGDERVSMIGITLLAYNAIEQRRTMHPAIILILGYFSYKSIAFVQRIFDVGTGFGT